MNIGRLNRLLATLAASMLVACSSGSGPARTTDLPTPDLQADPGVGRTTLRWTNPPGASSFNIYVSSARGCDIKNYASCPSGELIANATSPHTVENLRNGQAYFFRIESVYASGARGLSNEAGARPNVLAFNGEVRATATAADGSVYVAGGFTKAGVATGGAVVVDAKTGRLARPDLAMVGGEVKAAVPDGTGGWYVGGIFESVGEVSRKNLAHILADGTVDASFHPDPDNIVYALAVSGRFLYAGGSFESFAPAPGVVQRHVRLAAILADGTLDQSFQPIVHNDVRALAVSGSTLFVGSARHSSVVGLPTDPYLIACNTLDAASHPGELLSWNPKIDDGVSALAIAGGTVYAGGTFMMPRRRLVAIDATDSDKIDTRYPQAGRFVSSLAASGGTLFVGGSELSLQASNGTVRNNLAAIDTTGAIDTRYPDTETDVLAFAASANTLYVGTRSRRLDTGRRVDTQLIAFNTLEGVSHPGEPLGWNPDPNGDVLTLAVSGDTVFAGGSFSALGGTTRRYLAALDAGGALLPWNPDADAPVLALAVSGSTIYAGGVFTMLGASTHPYLAAVGADGVVDANFNPNPNGAVNDLALSNNTLYAGGHFTTLGATTRDRLAAMGTDGSLDPRFHPVIDDDVHALAVAGDKLYVGGAFSSIEHGNSAYHHLIAFNTLDAGSHPGELLTDWKPHVGDTTPMADGVVYALAASDSAVYAGGTFPNLLTSLVAIDAPTAAIKPGYPGSAGAVFALVLAGDTLYVGGFALGLKDASGAMHHSLAVIDANGTVDEHYPDADSIVTALSVTPNALYLGGYFREFANKARGFFATVNANTSE